MIINYLLKNIKQIVEKYGKISFGSCYGIGSIICIKQLLSNNNYYHCLLLVRLVVYCACTIC